MNVIYLGYSGPLYGTATGEKIRLICKSLINMGINVTILSKKKYEKLAPPECVNINKENESINFINVSNNSYHQKNFIKRNILKLVLIIKEIKILNTYVRKNPIDIGIISTRIFFSILFYRVLSKYFNFLLVLNYMELNSAMILRNGILDRVNDMFYEKFAFKMVDAVLPISHFLKDYVKEKNPDIPILITPVLVNIELYESLLPRREENDYYLFCGAAAYEEVIAFTIYSFELVKSNSVKLQLICHGTEQEINSIKSIIEKSPKSQCINVRTGLDYNELVRYYKGALALLIPLRPNLQDIARFPHKIGEYAASGKPIISNKYGEVVYYFTDGKNALLAEKYDTKLFAEKMQFVINNPKIAIEVGASGKQVAMDYFDYKEYGKMLSNFFEGL